MNSSSVVGGSPTCARRRSCACAAAMDEAAISRSNRRKLSGFTSPSDSRSSPVNRSMRSTHDSGSRSSSASAPPHFSSWRTRSLATSTR
jgi:hypothetical protein